MPAFSRDSAIILATCHPNIIKPLTGAIARPGCPDFTVLSGLRSGAQQTDLFKSGASQLTAGKSKHERKPAEAVDVGPYVKPYGVITGHPDQVEAIVWMLWQLSPPGENLGPNTLYAERQRQVQEMVLKNYALLIGYLKSEFDRHEIPVRLGIDWDGDYNLLDQNFHDLGHIELVMP